MTEAVEVEFSRKIPPEAPRLDVAAAAGVEVHLTYVMPGAPV